MSDTEYKSYAGADELKVESEVPELPHDEPVSVVVQPIGHGEAAQRAANRMHHSERTVNGGKRT